MRKAVALATLLACGCSSTAADWPDGALDHGNSAGADGATDGVAADAPTCALAPGQGPLSGELSVQFPDGASITGSF